MSVNSPLIDIDSIFYYLLIGDVETCRIYCEFAQFRIELFTSVFFGVSS